MKFRKKCLPRSFPEILSFLFIILVVPFGYCFQLFYVLPILYTGNSFWYALHASIGSFIMVNIVSNFIFVMVTDTSVDKKAIPVLSSVSPGWNFCSKCQARLPPRAWHCRECDVCILKRDHHCQFTACCIGHRNQRYFFFFIFYIAVGTSYALYFHTNFIFQCAYRYFGRNKRHAPLILVLAQSLSYSMGECLILFYGINLLGVVISVFFLYYHASSILRGIVMYERGHDIHEYDSESMIENIVQVLGNRWYLAWISPLVTSRLPGDGMKWVKCHPNKRI